MWGIIYSEIDQLLDARNDKEKQFIIAKSVVKKALLGFYYDWKTRGEYDGTVFLRKCLESMLEFL